jgi:hypothetical protein
MAAKYTDAERFCLQACQLLEVAQERAPDEVQNEQLFGTLLSMSRKVVEAEMAHSQAFRLRRKLLGESHPVTIDSMINIAACLHSLGFNKGGKLYLVEALKRQKMGPVIAAKSDQNLGYLLSRYGRHDETVPFLRRALEVREERLGATHLYVMWTRDLLGSLLIQLDEVEEGCQLLTHVWDICRQQLGVWHPYTMAVLDRIAGSSIDKCNPAKADRVVGMFGDAINLSSDLDADDEEAKNEDEGKKAEANKAMSASWVRAFRADLEAPTRMLLRKTRSFTSSQKEDNASVVAPVLQNRLPRDSFELRRLQPRYRQHSADFYALKILEEWDLFEAPCPRFPDVMDPR